MYSHIGRKGIQRQVAGCRLSYKNGKQFLQTELVYNFDDAPFLQDSLWLNQSLDDFQFFDTSTVEIQSTSWSCHQTKDVNKVGTTNAEKCRKYRNMK